MCGDEWYTWLLGDLGTSNMLGHMLLVTYQAFPCIEIQTNFNESHMKNTPVKPSSNKRDCRAIIIR